VIGRKENTMKVGSSRANMGPEDVLSGALISLLFVAGVLLSFGAPTKHATSSIEGARPEAAELVTSTPDSISPGEETAETASPELQLD
jgi:hypothetical protein